jgi:hypothetical protein
MALIPTTQVNVSPDDYKRRIAYALMQEGAKNEPIQAWTQGLAKLAQGALGGYQLYQADEKQKQDEADATQAYLKFLTPGGTPSGGVSSAPPQSAATPVAKALEKPVQLAAADPAAVTGPRPGGPVAPSGKVWGDAEAEAAGLYEKPKSPVATALANPNAPIQPTPVQTTQVSPTPAPTDAQMSDAKARIAALLQSPSRAERQLGKSLAEAEIVRGMKPPETTEDIREYERSLKDPAFRQYLIDMKRAGKPETTVNVGGGSDKQVFDAMDESAKAARTTAAGLAGLREAKAAIQGGAITGFRADDRLSLQKAGAFFGVADPGKIVNTETFKAAIAPQVAAVLKSTVGTSNISNTDREFAEKAAGGDINLDEKSITRLLDIMERASVGQLEAHQKRLDKVYSDPEKFARERALFGVDMPAALPVAPAPAPAPKLDGLKKKYGLD